MAFAHGHSEGTFWRPVRDACDCEEGRAGARRGPRPRAPRHVENSEKIVVDGANDERSRVRVRAVGQVEQHTSPFELQQVPTLFANFGKKFKHETVDNIPDLAPAVIVFGAMMGCVSSTPAVALSHSNARAARGCTHGGREGQSFLCAAKTQLSWWIDRRPIHRKQPAVQRAGLAPEAL